MKGTLLGALAMALLGGPLLAAGRKATDDDAAAREQWVALDHLDVALLGREIFRASNRVRREHHLPLFQAEKRATAAADDQAAMMALLLRCQHGNPLHGQENALERVTRQGLDAVLVLENVAMTPLRERQDNQWQERTYAQLAADIVQQWMESPGHRANLLNPNVTYLGCAARGSSVPIANQVVFAAQVFVRLQPALMM
jgi:uncharacterized protein YkwD